jgi:hypothetical protein
VKPCQAAFFVVLLSCVGAPPIPCTVCGSRCVSLETDSDNCGACGNSCGSGSVCLGGSCHPTCQGGAFECSDGCANLATDSNHCGDCTTQCSPQEACVGGQCTRVCVAPQTVCDSLCVDTSTSRAHCGGCDMPCPSGQVCSQSACVADCANRLSTCASDAGLSCADLDSDALNCGRCGNACGTFQRCLSGICTQTLATPRTCDALDAGPGPFFTQLYIGGAPTKPFTAICGADGGTYLALAHAEDGANFSRFAVGGVFTGSDVVSRFWAVRLDLLDGGQSYALRTDDFAFAQSTGVANRPSNPSISQVPYASASDCIANQSQAGTGSVDLRGTVFAAGPFALSGFMPAGTTTVLSFHQVVKLTGGGFCGGNGPAGAELLLRYCPAPQAEVCDGLDNDCNGAVDDLFDGGTCP